MATVKRVVGYQLLEPDGKVVRSWGGVWGQCPGIPNPLLLPDGLHIHAPELRKDYGNYSLHEWWMEGPERVSPASITRRQCALQLLEMQVISPGEALNMAKSGDMPQAVRSALEASIKDMDALIRAEIDFAAGVYYRDNELLKMMGLSEAELDEFFIAAGEK